MVWDRETCVLAQNVAALFAHSVVRRFRIRAFDVVVLPRNCQRMQFYLSSRNRETAALILMAVAGDVSIKTNEPSMIVAGYEPQF